MSLLLFSFIVFTANSTAVLAQTKIIDAKIDDSTLTIQFDNKPDYQARLSDSKKKVFLEFPYTLIGTHLLDSLVSTGRISAIKISEDDGKSKITLNLKNKYGYTTAYFPYTNRLKIFTVDWASITASEDFFYTGLLGMDIPNAAKESFSHAVDEGNNEAAMMMGIVLLTEGKPNSAEQYLLFSVNEDQIEPDAYGAMAQLYNVKSNPEYEKLFKEKFFGTGYKNLQYLKLAPIIERGNFIPDTNTNIFLDSLISDSIILEFNESLLPHRLTMANYLKGNKNGNLDSVHNERLKDVFAEENDSTNTQKGFAKLMSELPIWLEITLWILIAILSVVLYFYFKWRQKRILQINKVDKKVFNQEIELAQKREVNRKTAKKKKVTDIYSNQQDGRSKDLETLVAQVRKAQEMEEKAKADDKSAVSQTYAQNQSSASEVNPANKSRIEALISEHRIAEEKKEKSIIESEEKTPAPSQENQERGEEMISQLKNIPGISADVEMAMNMAQEKSRLKKEQLKAMNENENQISEDVDIETQAKEMGIDEASLETKRALDNIAGDENYYKELARKFGKKKDKD